MVLSRSDSNRILLRDIHPKNKKTVGERLALLAENRLYGQDVLSNPPMATGELIVSDNEIRVAFACTDWYLVHLVNSAGIPAVPFELSISVL